MGDVHALEDHHLVFHGDTVADRGAILHEEAVTDVAVTPDGGVSYHVGKCPDPTLVPDLVAFAQSMRMYEDTLQRPRRSHRTTHQFSAPYNPAARSIGRVPQIHFAAP